MDLFPRSFLIVFSQLAVGGMLSLSIPPFHEIDRGYYKSSAFVYFLIAVLTVIGRWSLWLEAEGPFRSSQLVELFLWSAFTVACGGYLITLWGERFILRARLFVATWAAGLAALIWTAESYVPGSGWSADAVLYPLFFVLSALLLGSVCSGMLLGHWYLIDPDLSLSPLRTILAFYVGCLAAQAALLPLGTILLAAFGSPEAAQAAQLLVHEHTVLLVVRVVISPLAAAALGWMIWRTLLIPQTMAATGLFYIAILSVVVGELLGRFILFRTGLPL